MAVKPIALEEFLKLSFSHPILDVRSPAEYAHAHIPGAYSLPLFDDEERKVVGTAYKQESREQAIKIGLDYFGPKMRRMIDSVEAILSQHGKTVTGSNTFSNSNRLLVHCWRGGMRSAGVAWLLDLYGFDVYTLAGGYKSFRQFVVKSFESKWSMKVLGGYTGSGKTALLEKLERLGELVIDLENLAFHKGSAFGHFGQPEQPSQEMFENKLGYALNLLTRKSGTDGVSSPMFWVEDESWRIGNVIIPQPFYKQMRSSQCYFLDIPFQERLQYILKDYGKADRENLISAVLRIQKRLGGLETKTAINCLVENDIEGAFSILLKYYDKWYLKGLNSREPGCPPVISLATTSVDPVRNAQLLLNSMN